MKKKNGWKAILVGDFSTVLDFQNNKNVEKNSNQMFSCNTILTINKCSRVTSNTATAIDDCITNTVVDTQFKSGIIQTDGVGSFSYYMCPSNKREFS